jgi:hypothetical protein
VYLDKREKYIFMFSVKQNSTERKEMENEISKRDQKQMEAKKVEKDEISKHEVEKDIENDLKSDDNQKKEINARGVMTIQTNLFFLHF